MSSSSPRIRILNLFLVPFLALGSYWVWHQNFRVSKVLRTHPVLKKDYEILVTENPETRVENLAIALHRLNSYRLPEGVKEALKRVNDPRPQVRAAVAESLSMNPLSGEILEAEMRLVSDPDESVRVSALMALAKRVDPRKKELFLKSLSGTQKTVREELILHSGLYMEPQISDREAHLKAILGILERERKNPDLYAFGFKMLLRISPRDEESLKTIQAAFTDSTTPEELMPAIYRYLVRNKPDILRKRFLKDSGSKSPAMRTAALNSVLELCPPERWSVIRSILGDPKMDSQSKIIARRVANSLGGKFDSGQVLKEPPLEADRCNSNRKDALPGPAAGKKQ